MRLRTTAGSGPAGGGGPADGAAAGAARRPAPGSRRGLGRAAAIEDGTG